MNARRMLLLAGGALLFGLAVWALLSIPRGPREFAYGPFSFRYTPFSPMPFAPMNGFTPEQLSSHLARLLLLGPACLLCGLGLAPLLARRRPAPLNPRAVILLGTLLVMAVAAFVLHGVPTSDDEPTYLYQAEQLVQARFFDPLLRRPFAFFEPFTIFTARGATGKYLFGTPLLLALGMPLGMPLLAQFLMVALTLACVFAAARKAAGATLASWGTLLLALSPQFVFASAAPLSQPASLAGVAVALWAGGRGGWLGGILAGTGLGLSVASRPQVGVACGVVLAGMFLWRDRRLLAGALLGGLPWLLGLLAYDAAVTGSALRLPWSLYFPPESYGFGFPLGDGVYHHGLIEAVRNTLVALVRLNGWGLGWPLSLLGPALWLLLGRPARAAVAPWAWMALATLVFQAGYYSIGTSDMGALYHHAMLPFVALSTAAVAEHLLSTKWGGAAAGVVLANLALGTSSFFVEHADRLYRLARQVEVPAQVDEPALLFLPDAQTRQAGWVFGIPLRARRESAPAVYYPLRPDEDYLRALRSVWPGRRCSLIFWDGREGAYRSSGCDQLEQVVATVRAHRTYVGRLPDGRPWWVEGGWKDAFRWVPGW